MKTAHLFRRPVRRAATGSVAVELAVILMPLALIFSGIFLFGRLFWQYNVALNATNLAARYAAAGTLAQLDTGTRREEARQLMRNAAREAGLTVVSVQTSCVPSTDCTTTDVDTIKAELAISVADPSFDWTSRGRFVLRAQSIVPFHN